MRDRQTDFAPFQSVFQFRSRASLERLTGQKASNLEELLELIRTCPDSSIFYHTFSAFRMLREVHVPYTNGFSVWISKYLNDEALAEKLATVDLTEHSTIESLRRQIVETIEKYRNENPSVFQKTADKPFYLLDAIRIVYLTDKFAYDLKSFRELLNTVSVDSLYFHFIESRLYTQLRSDDFSTWIEESLKDRELARKIRAIDISVYTLEELRERIIQVIDKHMK
ncbi:MAG: hypothetical protein JRH07_13270 [Deltaproteobacteria bacterium]|nr:hypothetical protein [Deltaproteobacteria bacterium]MBW2122795.1 hypothetical protein [Deltaproteobacteria bacterium]